MLGDNDCLFFLLCISESWKSNYPFKKYILIRILVISAKRKMTLQFEWPLINVYFCHVRCRELKFLQFFSMQFKILDRRNTPYLGHGVLMAERKSKRMGKNTQGPSSFYCTHLMNTCSLVIGKASHVTKPNFRSPQEAQTRQGMSMYLYWKK